MNEHVGRNDKVVVIIVSFGNYDGLENTVRSVLEQSYPIAEIILSDDGSGKSFPKEVLDCLKEAACPVSIRQGEENLGTTAHLNLLARQCSSDYLKFIGAGDAFSNPNALGALVNFMNQTGAMVVTSNAVIASPDLTCRYYTFPGSSRGEKLKEQGTELFRTLAKGNIVSAVGTVFHREFFSEMGGFDEGYRLLEDWPTWLRMAREGKRIAFLDRVTCLCALGGSSSKKGNAFYNDALRADMIRCYENEILPAKDCFTKKEVREIEYGYELLQKNGAWNLWKKFGWIHGRHLIKRGIKWSVLNIKTWMKGILSA